MIWFPRLLSFATGFLSLSQEILWIRFAGFAYRGAPQAFAFVLGMYLVGIAVGAALGRRYCRREESLVSNAGRILLVAGLLDWLMPWMAVAAQGHGRLAGIMALSAVVAVTALLKSMVFPIAHHLGSARQASRVGSSVSKVYFANILGSTFGPLVTGFVLLQHWTLQQGMLAMGGLTVAVGLACLVRAGVLGRPVALAATAAAASVLLAPNWLTPRLIARTAAPEYDGPLHHLLENRYGIIHTNQAPRGGDIVFGGNAYDGRINIDLVSDSNWISRTYILAALHPDPRRVLMIGLSGGAWVRVVSSFPAVEQIDVVEINPGYVELVGRYPELAGVLTDPRVRIHGDDGRRWLKRHPDRRYDLIVMNTSYHWRAYTSLLLSREFHAMARSHLEPGGLYAYNSTFSWDAFKTAATVFRHVHGFGNLVIASDHDPRPELAHGRERFAALRLDGAPVLDLARPEVAAKVDAVLRQVEPYQEILAKAGRDVEVITDENMITEYRYGQTVLGFFFRPRSGPSAPPPAPATAATPAP